MSQKFLPYLFFGVLCVSCSTGNLMQHSQNTFSQKLETIEQLNLSEIKQKMAIILPPVGLNNKIDESDCRIQVKELKRNGNEQVYKKNGLSPDLSTSIDAFIQYPSKTDVKLYADKKVPTEPTVSPPVNDARIVEGLGLAGFICAVVGLFVVGIVLGVLGIIFGAISLGRFRKFPNKYKGKGFAIASLVVGIVAFIGALLVISHVI